MTSKRHLSSKLYSVPQDTKDSTSYNNYHIPWGSSKEPLISSISLVNWTSANCLLIKVVGKMKTPPPYWNSIKLPQKHARSQLDTHTQKKISRSACCPLRAFFLWNQWFLSILGSYLEPIRAIHAKRITIMPKDIQLARRISGESAWVRLHFTYFKK